MRSTSLTESQISIAIELRKQGTELKAIAAQLGIDLFKLKGQLRRFGVTHKRDKLAPVAAELVAAYQAGAAISDLASKYRANTATVRRALTDRGIEIRAEWTRVKGSKLAKMFGKEEVAKMVEMYNSGKSMEDIRNEFHISAPTVSKILRGQNVAIRTVGPVSKDMDPDERHYMVCARQYKVSVDTIRELLTTHKTCQICGATADSPRNHRAKRLCIDHCHETEGVIRGVLCASCNMALGSVQSDPNILKNMASFLQRENQTTAAAV